MLGRPLATEWVAWGGRMDRNPHSGLFLRPYKTRVCVVSEILLSSHCGWRVPAAATAPRACVAASPPRPEKVGAKVLPVSLADFPHSTGHCWVTWPALCQLQVKVTGLSWWPETVTSTHFWLVATKAHPSINESWVLSCFIFQ